MVNFKELPPLQFRLARQLPHLKSLLTNLENLVRKRLRVPPTSMLSESQKQELLSWYTQSHKVLTDLNTRIEAILKEFSDVG